MMTIADREEAFVHADLYAIGVFHEGNNAALARPLVDFMMTKLHLPRTK